MYFSDSRRTHNSSLLCRAADAVWPQRLCTESDQEVWMGMGMLISTHENYRAEPFPLFLVGGGREGGRGGLKIMGHFGTDCLLNKGEICALLT